MSMPAFLAHLISMLGVLEKSLRIFLTIVVTPAIEEAKAWSKEREVKRGQETGQESACRDDNDDEEGTRKID